METDRRQMMGRLSKVLKTLQAQPRYALMRGMARFASVRHLVAAGRQIWHARRLSSLLKQYESRMSDSIFPSLDRVDFVRKLRENGVAFGLRLPEALIAEISAFARQNPCYADRRPSLGFGLEQRAAAETALGKPILLAQYFNVAGECPAVARLLSDPALQWIASKYLQSEPTFVGANLWWTFPVKPLEEDRNLHAQLFHRDVDDFRFFKFFFYLTDVDNDDGAHVCVVASHRKPPLVRRGDRWNIRRYSDAEIEGYFPADKIVEISGPAGTGFAENTLCVHKGLTPTRQPRLLLQLQFALFDYGVLHDRQDAATLRAMSLREQPGLLHAP
jgi:hypothetical protein